VFDAASFPRSDILAHFSHLTLVAMDTYDFIRLEPEPLQLLTSSLETLYLAGAFVAHHEARKVLAKLPAVTSFKTDNFIEPHVDLTPLELAHMLTRLQGMTSLGVIFDNPRSGQSFWADIPRLPKLREIAVGITDLSSESSLTTLLMWLPPTCEILYLQFAECSNPLKSALHCLNPLVEATQHDEELEPHLPRLRKLFLDMCGTVANVSTLQDELQLRIPRVEVKVSARCELVTTHFFSHPIFSRKG